MTTGRRQTLDVVATIVVAWRSAGSSPTSLSAPSTATDLVRSPGFLRVRFAIDLLLLDAAKMGLETRASRDEDVLLELDDERENDRRGGESDNFAIGARQEWLRELELHEAIVANQIALAHLDVELALGLVVLHEFASRWHAVADTSIDCPSP
jgi:hypothetical protein